MTPPLDPALGPLMVIVTSVMHVILIPLFAARLYGRIVPDWRVSWDGYFLIAAVIFDLIQWVFLLVSIGSGYGHHPDYVDPQRLIPLAKFLFLCQPVSVWALSCAKISVACCLLRIQRGVCSASRRTFLFCLIGLQVIITAIINYFQLNTCRPLRANWGESAPDTQCIDQAAARTSIYVNLAMIAFTDLTFALLPLSMLRDRPPVHEKVAIYSIVLTGFLSTGATVARMTFVKDFVIGRDIVVNAVGLTICTNLEMQFAIIAASIACLKRPLVKFLQKAGAIDIESSPDGCHGEQNSQVEGDKKG